MADALLTVDDRQLKQLLIRLNKLPPKLRRKEPMFKKIAVYLNQWMGKNFRQQGWLAHKKRWEKLKPATIARRRKGRGKGSIKILQDTGRGKASIKTYASTSQAKVFTRLSYMIAHQTGKGVPERRILPEREQVMKKVVQIADMHIREAVRRSGLRS